MALTLTQKMLEGVRDATHLRRAAAIISFHVVLCQLGLQFLR